MKLTPLLLSLSLMALPVIPVIAAPDANADAGAQVESKECKDGFRGPRGHHGRHGAFAKLTEEERQQLRAAFEKIKENQGLKDAREEVKAAMEKMHEARRAALLEADPTLGPILDKLAEGKGDKAPNMDRKGARPGRPHIMGRQLRR